MGVVSPEEIDKINILNASFLAMHRAVDQLNVRPQHLLMATALKISGLAAYYRSERRQEVPFHRCRLHFGKDLS